MTKRTFALPPAWVLATVCLGYAMVVVDTTAVNVALPTIGDDLAGSVSGLQWVVDGYVLVFAALLVAGGSAGDRFGPAAVFAVGVAVFGAFSAACALATSLSTLIAARALQGVGAALLAPACLALIARTYAGDGPRRARATAVFVTAAGSPQAFGPLLGGALVQLGGWRAIFWINVPVALVTCVAGLLLRGDERRSAAPTRAGGHLLVLLAVAALTTVVIEAPERSVASVPVLVAGATFVATAALLVRHETHVGHPAVAPALLRPPVVISIGVGSLLFAGYYGLTFVLSLLLQRGLGLGAFDTGLVMVASALGIFVLPLGSARLVRRYGALALLRTGLLTALVGALVLAIGGISRTDVRETGLAILGAGVGLSVTPQITLTLDTSPAAALAQASGVLNAARQLGTVIGVAGLGALVTPEADPRLVIAWAGCGAAALLALALVATVATTGQGRVPSPRSAEP